MSDWIRHKRCDWVLSGLVVDCWEGDKDVFLSTSRNSNPVESSGAQSNRLGTSQNLMAAVKE